MPKYCLKKGDLDCLARGKPLPNQSAGGKPTKDKPSSRGKPSSGHQTKETLQADIDALKKQISDKKELKALQQENASLQAQLEALSCDDSKDE